MPNQRQSRARSVVKGMAAEDLAPQSNRFRTKKIENTIPGTSRAVISTLDFQRRPPITEGGREGGGREGGEGGRREGGGEGGREGGRERGRGGREEEGGREGGREEKGCDKREGRNETYSYRGEQTHTQPHSPGTHKTPAMKNSNKSPPPQSLHTPSPVQQS